MDIELSPALPSMSRSGDERTTLTEMLDYYRTVLERKSSGLSAAQLDTTLAPSDLTLGGLMFHMAFVEDIWFEERFMGNPKPEPWASVDWEADWDWEMHNASSLTPQELVDRFHLSVQRSNNAVLSADSMSQKSATKRDDGGRWNLRWIMVHMIEEYARHCGHADFIRQSIDGVTYD